MADLNQDLCRKLWNRYCQHTLIEPDEPGGPRKWRPQAVEKQDSASGKASFLGYFDLTVGDDLGFLLKLRSMEAKVIKGRFAIDFPSEKSTQTDEQGKPKYFPRYLTKTAESRDVLTKLVFRDPRIKAAAEDAIARYQARQEVAGASAPESASEEHGAETGEFHDEENPF